MKALTKVLAGGIGLAALAGAAPAAAQYYPGYPYGGYGGYGYGQQGGLGAIIDQILGGNRYAYGVDQRMLVERCIAAVTNRVQRDYAYNRYGYPYGQGAYGGYGYAGGARVLGITDIDRDSRELQVRGIATANANMGAYGSPYGGYGQPYGQPYGGYGQPYGQPYGGYGYAQPVGELRFKCDIDYRGRVTDIDLDRNRNSYSYPYRRY
jgi:hypothetical protein